MIYWLSVQAQAHFKSRGNLPRKFAKEGQRLMVALNIGELARQAGVHTSAIRYYESIGLISPPPRTSGWRKYDPSPVDTL